MKIFTRLLLGIGLVFLAQLAIAQCGSPANVQVESCDPLPESSIQQTTYCNANPATWDCENDGGVTHYFIVNPANQVTIGGTIGAEILGTSTSPVIVPDDYGFPEGTCLDVIAACYDLTAMQDLVCSLDNNTNCCTGVNAVFPGVCDGIIALFTCANPPQDLGDVVEVVQSFNEGNPISIDFFAFIADQILASTLLPVVCDGSTGINYCTDTIPNPASQVYFVTACALSIDLTSLEGTNTNIGNELKWTTSTETNNDYFLIERSFDGNSFEEIGMVEGAGNSSSEISYKFMDDKVSGTQNYYRITSVSYDELKDYSNVIAIETTNSSTLDAVNIVPNPVKSTVNLSFDADEIGDANIMIIDATGKVMANYNIEVTLGYNELEKDLSELSNGLYMTVIRMGSTTVTEKFLKL